MGGHSPALDRHSAGRMCVFPLVQNLGGRLASGGYILSSVQTSAPTVVMDSQNPACSRHHLKSFGGAMRSLLRFTPEIIRPRCFLSPVGLPHWSDDLFAILGPLLWNCIYSFSHWVSQTVRLSINQCVRVRHHSTPVLKHSSEQTRHPRYPLLPSLHPSLGRWLMDQ